MDGGKMVQLMTQFAHGSRLAAWLETAWLQRYLERRLDADETAWFEAYLLDKPALIGRLERDTDLRDGLDLVHDGDALAAAQPADSDGLPQRAVGRRRHLRALALAATLAAAVGVGWFGRGVAPGGNEGVMASPMRIVYDTERGAATPPHVEHRDSDAPYALVEVALPPGAQGVKLHLAGTSDQQLQPSPDGFVSFLIARRRLLRDAGAELSYELDGAPGARTLSFAALPTRSGK